MINSCDANALTREVARLTKENDELLKELWNQWAYNHAEHCGRGGDTPHDGLCTWPVPKVLEASPKMACELLPLI